MAGNGQRAPGQHARERAGALGAWLIGTVGFSVLVLLVAWREFGGRGWKLVLIMAAAIGLMAAAQRELDPQIARWLQGARGEERVGAVLRGLQSRGWHAIHGIFLGRGDVDHVVIGPGGVFAIETWWGRCRLGARG
jgi:hypothetical protein